MTSRAHHYDIIMTSRFFVILPSLSLFLFSPFLFSFGIGAIRTKEERLREDRERKAKYENEEESSRTVGMSIGRCQ